MGEQKRPEDSDVIMRERDGIAFRVPKGTEPPRGYSRVVDAHDPNGALKPEFLTLTFWDAQNRPARGEDVVHALTEAEDGDVLVFRDGQTKAVAMMDAHGGITAGAGDVQCDGGGMVFRDVGVFVPAPEFAEDAGCGLISCQHYRSRHTGEETARGRACTAPGCKCSGFVVIGQCANGHNLEECVCDGHHGDLYPGLRDGSFTVNFGYGDEAKAMTEAERVAAIKAKLRDAMDADSLSRVDEIAEAVERQQRMVAIIEEAEKSALVARDRLVAIDPTDPKVRDDLSLALSRFNAMMDEAVATGDLSAILEVSKAEARALGLEGEGLAESPEWFKVLPRRNAYLDMTGFLSGQRPAIFYVTTCGKPSDEYSAELVARCENCRLQREQTVWCVDGRIPDLACFYCNTPASIISCAGITRHGNPDQTPRPGLRCQMHGDFEGIYCPVCYPSGLPRQDGRPFTVVSGEHFAKLIDLARLESFTRSGATFNSGMFREKVAALFSEMTLPSPGLISPGMFVEAFFERLVPEIAEHGFSESNVRAMLADLYTEHVVMRLAGRGGFVDANELHQQLKKTQDEVKYLRQCNEDLEKKLTASKQVVSSPRLVLSMKDKCDEQPAYRGMAYALVEDFKLSEDRPALSSAATPISPEEFADRVQSCYDAASRWVEAPSVSPRQGYWQFDAPLFRSKVAASYRDAIAATHIYASGGYVNNSAGATQPGPNQAADCYDLQETITFNWPTPIGYCASVLVGATLRVVQTPNVNLHAICHLSVGFDCDTTVIPISKACPHSPQRTAQTDTREFTRQSMIDLKVEASNVVAEVEKKFLTGRLRTHENNNIAKLFEASRRRILALDHDEFAHKNGA
jgi:hypothetical protein